MRLSNVLQGDSRQIKKDMNGMWRSYLLGRACAGYNFFWGLEYGFLRNIFSCTCEASVVAEAVKVVLLTTTQVRGSRHFSQGIFLKVCCRYFVISNLILLLF